ncbi:membrane-spanning 4-domains subfamily A member 4D-like isoform X2 [Mixophyes fleayi]|uniref:membrane-spanning 4-domains subfamily A member 4D-like isoform X2 n=1 Tax=Mixophyes fleayi TaxID=3061075 RepID=UPI003F4E0A55
MSSRVNEIHTPIYETVQYDNAPPVYSTISMSDVYSAPPTGQPWDEFPLPPAYDTLPDLPIWSVPLTASQSNTLSNIQQWNVHPQLPAHNASSSSALQQNSSSVCSQMILTANKRKFQRWKQGVVAGFQLLAAFIQVGAGTALASNEFGSLSKTLLFGIPFWGPVCYLVTGCLLITAYFTPSPRRVKLSLSFNIITMILNSFGLAYNVKDLDILCDVPPLSGCYERTISASRIHYILISTNVLLLCLSVFAAIIGFYVLCCLKIEDSQSSVIENNFVSSMTSPDFFETPPLPPPPPYTPQGVFKGSTTM